MRRVGDRMRLAGLLAAELAAVILLHAVGRGAAFTVDWSDPLNWLSSATPEEAAAALAWTVALGLAYWLLLSTVLCLLAALTRRRQAVRAIRWLTLPVVRRIVGRSLAISLSASLGAPLALAGADETGGPPTVVVAVADEGLLRPPGYPIPAPPVAPLTSSRDVALPESEAGPVVEPTSDLESATMARAPMARFLTPNGAPRSHTVKPGEHLWMISENHLARVTGRADLGDHEIAPYWARVVEANEGTVRSGDPDLIYPGEVITLPPVSEG